MITKVQLRGMLLFGFALMALAARIPANAQTALTWYGHSAFKVKTPSGKVLLIDPWITNPSNPTGKEDVAGLGKVDLILISHGHQDHVGDAVEIAKRTGARLVSSPELGSALVQYAGYPKAQVTSATQGNSGGELTFFNGEVKIAFTPAVHSSSIVANGETHTTGNPNGFLITIRGGPVIYHTGDTDLFSDMALIPHFHRVTVMIVCIGGHYTMGPERAAEAVKLVHPTMVIPMHYGTMPLLAGTPQAFARALKAQGVKSTLNVMRVHETIVFSSSRCG